MLYTKIYIFFWIILITLVQVTYFILSGEEIYPGITYPSFSKQFNVIWRERGVPCMAKSEYVIATDDFCVDGFMNIKYSKTKISLYLVFGTQKILVRPQDFFWYISTSSEEAEFRRKILSIWYWWSLPNDVNISWKNQFVKNILAGSKKIAKNKNTSSNIPDFFVVSMDNGKNIMTTSIPLY